MATAKKKETGVNATRSLSSTGVLALQRNEGFRRNYYDDTANNCTYESAPFRGTP